MSARLRGLSRYTGDVLVAVLAGVTGVLGSYALAGFTPSFVAGPVAGFLSRTMPGVVVTLAIVLLGDLGEVLNLAVALGLAVALLATTSLAGVAIARRAGRPGLTVPAVALLGWLAAVAVTGAPGASLGAGVGAALAVAAAGFASRSTPPVESVSPERRRVLASLASAVVVGVAGVLLNRGAATTPGAGGEPEETSESVERVADYEATETFLDEAAAKSLDVADLEPLVSDEFYRVDINATDPEVAREDWSLSVTGVVEESFSLTYEELTAMESRHEFVTLRCVGEQLNGRKMDNALWTGTDIAPLIERAKPMSECECVMLRAADGYFEEFPLEALRRGFLAWGMNGTILPRGHGHPVRALIPGHWGEINVKWITEIEFLEKEVDGYWEKRGWHGTGPVNTVAKLHAVNELGGGRLEVGGHTYAGIRGVDRVEVSIDGGETWRDAELSEPLPGVDVWRQWRFEYDNPGREHQVVVRATDGTGTVQPEEESGAFPSGPSGWVRRTVDR